jgi:hypothetical protein
MMAGGVLRACIMCDFLLGVGRTKDGERLGTRILF